MAQAFHFLNSIHWQNK